jgi:hypothetical protein
MKKCLPILMLTLLTGCNEPKHVSGADFKREWELRDAQTMVCSEYLGEKDGKVFLKRKTMSLVSKERWNEEIWFTETNNLDSAFLDQMKKETTAEPGGGGTSNMPATNMVVDLVTSPVTMKGLLRNSRSSSNNISTAVWPEAAVMRSLRWLRETQNADGSWSTDQDPKAVGTALSVLAFLSHGETPASPEFGDSVRKALEYLAALQEENGTFKEAGKYPAIAHGSVAWALCEAYGITRVPMLGDAAEKALQVILVGQRGSGLWDAQYRPNGGDDDLEVSVWQVRAVHAGRLMGSQMAGLAESLDAAADGLAAVAPTSAVSSAPFVIPPLQILHRKRDADYVAALEAMKGVQIDWDKPQFDDPIVRWHLASQALYRHGGQVWNEWRRASMPNLVKGQIVEKTAGGFDVGYWDSPGKGEKYGRVYATALCSLMLWSGSTRPVYVPEQPKQNADNDEIKIDVR